MECYEFDAPSHVMDFNQPALDAADNADHWFDTQASNLATTPNNRFPFGASPKPDLPRAVVAPQVHEPSDSAPSGSNSPPPPSGSNSPPPNIVTSWGNRAPTRLAESSHAPSRMAVQQQNTSAQPPAQARRVSKRKQDDRNVVPDKKQRRVANTVTVRPHISSQPAKQSGPTPRRGKRPVRRSSTRRSGQKKPASALKTHAAAPVQPNSSEQQELEHIKRLQLEVAEHRKKNEASYKAALSGSHLPKRMALSTTVPKEFHFSTDGRVKADNPSDSCKEVDFVSQLRKHAASPSKASKGTTVPKPFNLSQGKRKGEEPAPYVSIAQEVERFHTRTPDRYHLRSRQREERGPSPKKAEQLKMTRPHTPRLMTRQRNRPTTVKSSAELEAEELDKLNKFKFKALELNRKILDSVSNPKKPATKESTKPEGFDFQMEKRIHDRQVNKKTEEEEEHHVFHAQPLPSKILAEVVGVPPKKVLLPTVPESPAFALKKRVRLERKVEVKSPSPVKSNPMPHFGLPFYPRPSDKSEVEVCPFSFEEREKERRALKEKRLEDLRNQEVQQFKAKPLPDFHEVHLPKKIVLEPTKLEPFKLQIDQRGAVKTDRWEHMVKEEQKRQAEATVFKAHPSNVVHKEPFLPKKESHSVLGLNTSTVPEAFELATERRARERQEFEKELSEKETLRACMEERQHQEQEQREKDEVAKMRQDQVHKAGPVRHYKPVVLKKSDLPMTVPESPRFSVSRVRL